MKKDVTVLGNPRKPQGEDGIEMLERMNESHYDLTTWALSFLEFGTFDTVLDIGCGGGLTLHRISSKVPDGKLYGIDYSSVSVEKSRLGNKEEISSGKMKVLEASVEKMPFDDNSFNKIVTVESFYFWPDPLENLKEVYRTLKKGGTFLLVSEIYAKNGLGKHALENIEKFNLFNPSITEFEQLFKDSGFEPTIHTKEDEDWICIEGKK